FLVGVAEGEEIGITWNDNFFGLSRRLARAARNHLSDQTPVGRIIHWSAAGIKSRVLKKLPRRSRQHETVVRVSRGRIAPMMRHFAGGGIEAIRPDQFVRVGESVLLKEERPNG